VQAKTPADAEVRAALQPLVKELIVLPRRPLKHPRSLWLAAFSRLPLLTSVNGAAPALAQRFEALLQQGGWDVVQIEHSYGFEPFEAALRRHQQPFVLVEHNVESELGAATYGKWPAIARPLARYDQWRAKRWERHVLPLATQVVAVTESDAVKLAQLGARHTHVVSNGVDIRGFAQVLPDAASQRVLFVGNYEYAPNVDAIEWALNEVWPRLWALQPQARFVVCGHAMPEAWRQRWPDPRIEWRGYVDSLPAVQSQAAVFMAPLRFGGGSKLKVLEALAASLPVVSTTEGLSGLGVQAGVQALVADEAQAMAQAVSELLSHPQRAAQLGQAARAHVTARFDWQACALQLEAAYAAISPMDSAKRQERA
jgi:glycosyltransferase involved in cell wall biosynthesis